MGTKPVFQMLFRSITKLSYPLRSPREAGSGRDRTANNDPRVALVFMFARSVVTGARDVGRRVSRSCFDVIVHCGLCPYLTFHAIAVHYTTTNIANIYYLIFNSAL